MFIKASVQIYGLAHDRTTTHWAGRKTRYVGGARKTLTSSPPYGVPKYNLKMAAASCMI